MNGQTTSTTRSLWLVAAWRGAQTGAGLAVIYAIAFAVYACARSLWTALSILEPPDALPTAGAMVVSLLVSIISISLLMALVCAALGALTALVVYALLRLLNPDRRVSRSAAIGLVVAAVVAALLYGLAQTEPGGHLAPVHVETWLFWLALPLLIYVVAGMIGARRLNALRPTPNAPHPLLHVR